MPEPLIELDYLEYDAGRVTPVHRAVINETPWVLYVDGRELITFMCSPVRLHALAIGFLASEGLISSLDDIWQIKVYLDEHQVYLFFPAAGLDEQTAMATCEEAAGVIDVRLRVPMPAMPGHRILTSGCGGGVTFDDLSAVQPRLESDIRVPATQIIALMRLLDYHAALYRRIRGVHTSALSDGTGLLAIGEDVGRHNTLDKIRGECLMTGVSTHDRILLTSGRVSSEMVTKARKMSTPIVVSRTSPTAMSIRLAAEWDMTLIGYVRPPRLRVYTGAERLIFFDSSATLDSTMTPELLSVEDQAP